MKPMNNVNITDNTLTVDRKRLASEILCCGLTTAEKIGKEAEAEIKIGKRKLYNVAKVRKYIDLMSI